MAVCALVRYIDDVQEEGEGKRERKIDIDGGRRGGK